MKTSLLSFGAGLEVGVVYSLLGVRSPAPPVVALIGVGAMPGSHAQPVDTASNARIGEVQS